MQPWEWLVCRDGRVLKCDALDHHAGHDVIGAQDVAWDVVGAEVELELSEAERAALVEAVVRGTGYRALPLQLPFFTIAYLAFQVGYWTLAMESLRDDEAELARIRDTVRHYSALLRRRLEA